MAEQGEGFAARWSRRKRAEEVAPLPEATPDPEALAAEEEALRAEEEANRLAAEAVDLDAVKYGDDFSVFLRRGVPEMLRRTALRKFFVSDPLLANLDGLNDYDIDYNIPSGKVYKSAWDATKGYLGKAEDVVETVSEQLKSPDTAPPTVVPETTLCERQDPAPTETPAQMADEPAPEAPRRVSLRRRLEV